MRVVQLLALSFAALPIIGAVRRPYIIGKLAVDQGWAVHDRITAPFRFTSSISLDAGNIDWLCPSVSKELSEMLVHDLRAQCDAVLVGSNTIIQDNPMLTVRRGRYVQNTTQPTRVIIDGRLQVGGDLHVLQDSEPTIVFATNNRQNVLRRNELLSKSSNKRLSIQLMPAIDDDTGSSRVDLSAVCTRLSEELGMKRVLLEGGPNLLQQCLRQGLVDGMVVIMAHHRFQEPVLAGFNDGSLYRWGFRCKKRGYWGADQVSYWVNSGSDDWTDHISLPEVKESSTG